MASGVRTIKQGNTFPSLKGEAKDELGLVNLTTATALTVYLRFGEELITGTPEAIDPPEEDADGVHFWNWEYAWQEGDTDLPGTYKLELLVEWAPGQKQTFPNSGTETLIIEPSLGGIT